MLEYLESFWIDPCLLEMHMKKTAASTTQSKKKLPLVTETIRALDDAQLPKVVGGAMSAFCKR